MDATVMQFLDTWWFRIILTIGVAVVAIAVATIVPTNAVLSPLVIYGIMTVALILVEYYRRGGSLLTTGLGLTAATPKHVLIGFATAIGALGVIGGVALAIGANFEVGTSGIEAAGIIGLLAASAGEEIVFRGTIFEAIRERFGPFYAVGIMAAFFGLSHAYNPGSSTLAVVNVTLAGILFGVMAVRTLSLWMPIFFHCTWNLTTRAVFGNVSGGDSGGLLLEMNTSAVSDNLIWLIDGPFGIEQGAVTAVVVLALLLAVIGWVKPDRVIHAARIRRDRMIARSNA